MMNEQLDVEINALRAFINTPISEQTTEQISEVMALLDIYKQPNEYKCPICFVDKALTLYNLLMKKKKTEKEYQAPRYILKDKVNVIFMGELVNEATITDEKAEKWVKMGLPLLFFKEYPKDETKNVDNHE